MVSRQRRCMSPMHSWPNGGRSFKTRSPTVQEGGWRTKLALHLHDSLSQWKPGLTENTPRLLLAVRLQQPLVPAPTGCCPRIRIGCRPTTRFLLDKESMWFTCDGFFTQTIPVARLPALRCSVERLGSACQRPYGSRRVLRARPLCLTATCMTQEAPALQQS